MSAIAALPTWWNQYGSLVLMYAQEYNVDPALVAAVIQQESGGNPNAQSSEGAIGLMQVVGGSTDPATNIQQGVAKLSSYISQFGTTLGLAAYNAGPGNVGTYGWNILNPGYLISQGWSSFDANQPFSYLQAVPNLWTSFQSLLGTSSPTSTTSPTSSQAGGSTTGSIPAPSSAPSSPPAPLSFLSGYLSSVWNQVQPPSSTTTSTDIFSQLLGMIQAGFWVLVGLVIAIVGLSLLVKS